MVEKILIFQNNFVYLYLQIEKFDARKKIKKDLELLKTFRIFV